MNLTPTIASLTRWIQSLEPRRPIGMTRLSKVLMRWLPAYAGEIRLGDGIQLFLDSRQPAERGLLFAGDRHRALSYWLKQNTPAGAYCLDVGSNIGFYALKFSRWAGPDGHIAAFEANPELVQRIRNNIALNELANVDVVARAVHHEPGTATFYIHANHLLSSINPRQNAVARYEVEKITIDSYIEQHRWPRLDIMKIDIEGHDLEGLLGARQTIQRFRPHITFEYKIGSKPDIAQAAFGFLNQEQYTLKALDLRSGKQADFDWRQGNGSVNVIGSPARKTAT